MLPVFLKDANIGVCSPFINTYTSCFDTNGLIDVCLRYACGVFKMLIELGTTPPFWEEYLDTVSKLLQFLPTGLIKSVFIRY